MISSYNFIKQRFFTEVWLFSEQFNISLGRFAPHVFGCMIGSKPIKIKGTYPKLVK